MLDVQTKSRFRTMPRLFNSPRLTKVLVILIATSLCISGLATIIILSEFSPLNPNLGSVIALLNLDLGLAVLLGVVLVRKIIHTWFKNKFSPAGSKLHIKMVISFGMVAIIPALLVVVFLGLFLNFGIETWFNKRVRTAVNASTVVAQLYLKEHQQNIRGIALSMANDLNRAAPRMRQNPRLLKEFIITLSDLKNLSEAVVVNSSGKTLARSQLSFSLGFNFSNDDLLKGILNGRPGEVIIITNQFGNTVRAGVKLEAFFDTYLLVGKFVDAQVLQHIAQTTGAADKYLLLEKNIYNLQTKFMFVFVLIAFLLLLSAIWIGWSIASKISTPIGKLIDAADNVGKGDLTTKVDYDKRKDKDEVGKLSHSFNLMTEQLRNQQFGLIEANRQLDERRRFTEVVLSGVSAGVIGLDKRGCIHLSNRSAFELLSIKLEEHVDEPLGVCIPEMVSLLDEVIANPSRIVNGEIKLGRNGWQKTLVVSIAAEKIKQEIIGFVVTFDDVSELLSAQRKAAWADVAQRIAHEIKNPLTPIQLSAERLKRKYKAEIKSDQKTFLMCTDTIIRQVKDIERMVDEFSSFSRMPEPDFKAVNLSELCTQSVFLEQNRFPDIDYIINTGEVEIIISGDRQQISQSLTNIMKNAAESIIYDSNLKKEIKGKIQLDLLNKPSQIFIHISDNGGGFSENLIDRISEPYVTTRENGTGLGLAIATKIMEDHNGEILLRNDKNGGATVTLVFNKIV
ncbi:MAG TPA: PAS domain-containing sensor histidine kinase [Rhodospirillales bacterium]|nr:PAS domain-containing sensor histidine kinase [Rhodospirillales bacterium]